MKLEKISTDKIFTIQNDLQFNEVALEIFHYQYQHNKLYKSFTDNIYKDIHKIRKVHEIPFLPVEFFKTQQLMVSGRTASKVFLSSGTAGENRSKHYISDLNLYQRSFLKCFRKFYGDPSSYIILALLPSYLEQKDSSLIYMTNKLIQQSKNKLSGFFLSNFEELAGKITEAVKTRKRILLFGVTYALLDFSERYPIKLRINDIVMETGGMKGRRKEMVREEVHKILAKRFGLKSIHSEYGMTELLSQAYSQGEGKFKCPPWMKILIRDINDPLTVSNTPSSGGINIIDLANLYSCPFVATQDLGKTFKNKKFEVLGRYDSSDIRGCNLLIA